MKSAKVNIGDSVLASQYNNLRDDAFGAGHLLPHEQTTPDLTLKVESGIVYVGATRVVFAGGNSPSFTAPTANPRIDLLVIDNTGTLSRVAGTEAASPSIPTYPADKVVICEVYNRVGQTTIRDTDTAGQGYIQRDVRPFLGGSFIADNSQVSATASISPSKLNAGNVDADWLPDADNTRKLGSSLRRWSELRAALLYGDGSNITGITTEKLEKAFAGVAAEAIAIRETLLISDGTQTITVLDVNSTGVASEFGSNLDNTHKGQKIAQSFQESSAITLKSVVVRLKKQGAPTDNVVLAIQADSAGAPSGTDLGSASVAGSGLSATFAAVTFTFGSTISLSASAIYWIVLRRDGALSDTNDYVADISIGNPYASGQEKVFKNGSSTWVSDNGSADIDFELVHQTAAGEILRANASSASYANAFAGFAKAAAAKGAAVTGVVAGVVSGFTGLTTGKIYYLSDTAGAIATTAGTVTRKVAVSISTTELLITNIP